MFKLYYFFAQNAPLLMYSNDDLAPCLDFIKINKYLPCRCVIVSPNNRRITFNSNNDLVFGGLN